MGEGEGMGIFYFFLTFVLKVAQLGAYITTDIPEWIWFVEHALLLLNPFDDKLGYSLFRTF